MSLLFRIMAIAGPAGFGGVMLAIGIILGGHWKSLPPADFLDSFGRYGGFIQRAIPLVVIPTLIGLAGMLWIDWNNAATRNLWLAEAGCIAAILVLTMAYFAPSNNAFAARAVAVDQVSAKLDTWLFVHNFRIALAFAASSLGVWALSR
ncbi:hypothetical protein CO671_28795 [Rhizobium sp. M10]|uniref:anthrone oxygenase family protein n=1 Tax=Rhizobium sp. M10 TaxID=1324586 RepID=UPI000BEAADAE|nr:DUF1772 domain-containing protein [Rhizobium sp. M10]PDT32626.1 hypothetical protein CO671_28795 [Rhizobium sp. M10]